MNLSTAIKLFSFIILSAVLATACKKYEDGPTLSLRSKKERIANSWRISEATRDGDDVTNGYDQYELTLTKDGDATLVVRYDFGDFEFSAETDGTWTFSDNKQELRLDFENDDSDATYQILRLTEDELWLRQEGEDLELKLVPR